VSQRAALRTRTRWTGSLCRRGLRSERTASVCRHQLHWCNLTQLRSGDLGTVRAKSVAARGGTISLLRDEEDNALSLVGATNTCW
jgi:hypothetical protein